MNQNAFEIELKKFAHNVAWLRKHHSLSKKKMAQSLGICVKSLNKLERGDVPIRLGVNIFFHIHRHFEIPPKDQLMHRLGDHEIK